MTLRWILAGESRGATAEFYSALLGVAPDESVRLSRIAISGASIDFLDASELPAPLDGSAGIQLVVEVENVPEVLAVLEAAGGQLVAETTQTSLGNAAVVRDPDGRNVVVVKPHKAHSDE